MSMKILICPDCSGVLVQGDNVSVDIHHIVWDDPQLAEADSYICENGHMVLIVNPSRVKAECSTS